MDEKKPTKTIPVRVVGITGKSALVEWQDKKGLHRASLPAPVGEKVDLELLEAAPPYGVPWADMPLRPVSGDLLQAALYAAGFWTLGDVQKRAPEIFGILQALFGLHLGSLVEFAEAHKLNEVTK